MTFKQFAQHVVNDPEYRDNLLKRARAGMLPPDVEALLIETASGMLPLATAHEDSAPPAQSRTLALIRPSAFAGKEVE